MFCSKCGNKVGENDKFCNKCGKSLYGGDSSAGASLKETSEKAVQSMRDISLNIGSTISATVQDEENRKYVMEKGLCIMDYLKRNPKIVAIALVIVAIFSIGNFYYFSPEQQAKRVAMEGFEKYAKITTNNVTIDDIDDFAKMFPESSMKGNSEMARYIAGLKAEVQRKSKERKNFYIVNTRNISNLKFESIVMDPAGKAAKVVISADADYFDGTHERHPYNILAVKDPKSGDWCYGGTPSLN